MYVLIGGAGMMGLGLAQQLLDLGHTVAIVDADPIVVRMSDREFLEAYRLAQASHIISTIDLAVATMANAIEYPEVESMMHFEQGKVEVLKLSVPK